MNRFYEIYMDALNGLNTYSPLRVDWWQVPGRDDKWKAETIANMGSEEDFNQEYGLQFFSSDRLLLSSKDLKKIFSIATKYEEPLKINWDPEVLALMEGNFTVHPNLKDWDEQDFRNSPDQYVYELPLLNSQGISSQVALSRGPEVSLVEQPMSLPELFERTAQAHPDAVAIAYESTRLTYSELDARANQLAHHLLELGVGPDQIVAILLDRTPEMVIAILATLKVGAAYLPLDPDYPAVRLEFMLGDSGANILATTRQSYLALVQGIHEARTEGLELVAGEGDVIPEFVLYLDDAQHQKMIEQLPTTAPSRLSSKPSIFPEHLAYLIYTSGSTGNQ
jgi:hypothetical protein